MQILVLAHTHGLIDVPAITWYRKRLMELLMPPHNTTLQKVIVHMKNDEKFKEILIELDAHGVKYARVSYDRGVSSVGTAPVAKKEEEDEWMESDHSEYVESEEETDIEGESETIALSLSYFVIRKQVTEGSRLNSIVQFLGCHSLQPSRGFPVWIANNNTFQIHKHPSQSRQVETRTTMALKTLQTPKP